MEYNVDVSVVTIVAGDEGLATVLRVEVSIDVKSSQPAVSVFIIPIDCFNKDEFDTSSEEEFAE